MNALSAQEPLYATVIALVIALVCGPFTISYLRRLKLGQNVRDDGPKRHLQKAGTPSMGGVLIMVAVAAATLLVDRGGRHVPMALFAALGFGLIGFVDDLISILTRRSLGLKARQKLLGQLAIALLIGLYALTQDDIGSALLVPFTGTLVDLPPTLFVLLAVGVVVGTANAVNFTDGLDGLAAGSTAIAAGTYAFIALWLGNMDMAVFAGAIAGACLGFSWFNAHPASVIMGDTGSLGLGAALACLALFTRTTLFLPLIGGLFVVETISVIWQVLYFRATKGRRFFKMAPLHHHFELLGWAEPKVTTRFWLVGFVFAALGLLAVL